MGRSHLRQGFKQCTATGGSQATWEKKMDWNGTEIVMDAGSGSGNLTKILADKVPQRHVYAVDADPNMVQQAKSNLSDYKRQRRCTIAADPEL